MTRANTLRAASANAAAGLIRTALALGLWIAAAHAAELPTCEQIRAQAKNYTMKQIAVLAKRARLTPEQWAQVQNCLKDKR